MRWWSFPTGTLPGMPHSASCSDETYQRLHARSLGYTLAATFKTPSLVQRQLSDYASVNPPAYLRAERAGQRGDWPAWTSGPMSRPSAGRTSLPPGRGHHLADRHRHRFRPIALDGMAAVGHPDGDGIGDQASEVRPELSADAV